mgnify:CR=1 FL=1
MVDRPEDISKIDATRPIGDGEEPQQEPSRSFKSVMNEQNEQVEQHYGNYGLRQIVVRNFFPIFRNSGFRESGIGCFLLASLRGGVLHMTRKM